MTANGTVPEHFLEPFYLNEKMVLNCAAYVFKGYSLENDVRTQVNNEGSKSLKAGLKFLNDLLSFGGEAQSKQSQIAENKSARRYTVGGLHMSLIDELHNRMMLQAIDPEHLEEDLEQAPSYVEMPAVLRPIDFYALIDTLRISSPIIGEVLKSFVRPLYDNSQDQQRKQQANQISPSQGQRSGSNRQPTAYSNQTPPDLFQVMLSGIDGYVSAVDSVLRQLEDDYRRSKQLEMVMWSFEDNPRPYGVVDLDLGDYDPIELRAKLSDAKIRVIGKVTRVVTNGESINLLQKSAVYSALSLFNRVMEIQGQTSSLTQYQEGLIKAKQMAEQFGLLEVHGPAVRVAAMSICI